MNFRDILSIARTVDRFSGIEGKFDKALEVLKSDMAGLNARVTRLEAREDIVVVEAKAAAGSAASMAATAYIADLARRVGYLEASSGQPRDETSGPARLAPG